MSGQLSRSARSVSVADHLWDAYALMADEMGVDRDSLVNQALFAFARNNGYLTPGTVRPATAPAPVPEPAPQPVYTAPAAVPAPVAAPEPVQPAPVQVVSAPPEPVSPQPQEPEQPQAPEVAEVPAADPLPSFHYDVAASARVADDATPASPAPAPAPAAVVAMDDVNVNPFQTVAIRGSSLSQASTPRPALVEDPAPTLDAAGALTADEVRLAQQRVLQKAAELEKLVRGEASESEHARLDESFDEVSVSHEENTPAPAVAAEPTLVLFSEDKEVDRVTNARFLIGRGKHCDLIINSGKVSREHAAIVREGDIFFIEDLGSSNGTWFDKKRITRRQIEDGDEYYVCSEKLTCRLDG